ALGEKLRHMRDAANVLGAVGAAEAEIGAEASAHVVGVDELRLPAGVEQMPERGVGDRGFPGAREPREPNDAAAMAIAALALGARDARRDRGEVALLRELDRAVDDEAAGDMAVRQENAAPGRRIVLEAVEAERNDAVQQRGGDATALDARGRADRDGFDADGLLEADDRGIDLARADAHLESAPGGERLLVEPEHARGDGGRHDGCRVRRREKM